MLDYRLVEAFAAVATEGGFEKAARGLHVTQSAVSQRVKLLEERVGCVLLVRSSPPEPTAAGRELLRHYRQVRRLEQDLSLLAEDGDAFVTLPVAINADSLATWFFPAVEDYLARERVLLDLRVDDQAETHRLLRDGEVLGCVSARGEPLQGCRTERLGTMTYRLYAAPSYRERWFPKGVTPEAAARAPMLIYNRKDATHVELLTAMFGSAPDAFRAFYLPSSERFAPVLAAGRTCGMLPDRQAAEYAARGELVDLAPGRAVSVPLFWRCWNLASPRLEGFTEALTAGARRELAR